MSVQPQLQATPDLADLDAWVEFHAAVQDWPVPPTTCPWCQKADVSLFI